MCLSETDPYLYSDSAGLEVFSDQMSLLQEACLCLRTPDGCHQTCGLFFSARTARGLGETSFRHVGQAPREGNSTIIKVSWVAKRKLAVWGERKEPMPSGSLALLCQKEEKASPSVDQSFTGPRALWQVTPRSVPSPPD